MSRTKLLNPPSKQKKEIKTVHDLHVQELTRSPKNKSGSEELVMLPIVPLGMTNSNATTLSSDKPYSLLRYEYPVRVPVTSPTSFNDRVKPTSSEDNTSNSNTGGFRPHNVHAILFKLSIDIIPNQTHSNGCRLCTCVVCDTRK